MENGEEPKVEHYIRFDFAKDHGTEVNMKVENVDLGQMIIARDGLANYIERWLRQQEIQMAATQQSVMDSLRGGLNPKNLKEIGRIR